MRAATPAALRLALRNAWAVGRVYWLELGARHHFPTPTALFAELDSTFGTGR